MRIPRRRVFDISVSGKESWREDAGNRCGLDLQHQLATESFPGALVRVRELYLGGAKVKPKALEGTEEEEPVLVSGGRR